MQNIKNIMIMILVILCSSVGSGLLSGVILWTSNTFFGAGSDRAVAIIEYSELADKLPVALSEIITNRLLSSSDESLIQVRHQGISAFHSMGAIAFGEIEHYEHSSHYIAMLQRLPLSTRYIVRSRNVKTVPENMRWQTVVFTDVPINTFWVANVAFDRQHETATGNVTLDIWRFYGGFLTGGVVSIIFFTQQRKKNKSFSNQEYIA